MAWHKVLVSSSTARWWLVCHRLSSWSDWLIAHTLCVRRRPAVGVTLLSHLWAHGATVQVDRARKVYFDGWFETWRWRETPLKGIRNQTSTWRTAASSFVSNIFERRNWFMLSQAYSPWEAIQNCTFVPLIISQLSMSEMGHEAFPFWFVRFWQNKPLNVCMKAPCRCSWRNHLSSS